MSLLQPRHQSCPSLSEHFLAVGTEFACTQKRVSVAGHVPANESSISVEACCLHTLPASSLTSMLGWSAKLVGQGDSSVRCWEASYSRRAQSRNKLLGRTVTAVQTFRLQGLGKGGGELGLPLETLGLGSYRCDPLCKGYSSLCIKGGLALSVGA